MADRQREGTTAAENAVPVPGGSVADVISAGEVFSEPVTDDAAGAGWMTREEFRAEKMYYISLSVIGSMREREIIDQELSDWIRERLLEKYRPVSGLLLAGRPSGRCAGREDTAGG